MSTRERQLRLYGHVAGVFAEDPANRILSCRDRVAGPYRGGVHTLHGALCGGLSEVYGHDGPGVCLGDGQTEAYLKYMGMTSLASAWAMARRRPI